MLSVRLLLTCVAFCFTSAHSEYLGYEDCADEARAAASACWNVTNALGSSNVKVDCMQYKRNLEQYCETNSGSGACIGCFEKRDVAVRECKTFLDKVGPKTRSKFQICTTLARSLEQACIASSGCKVCQPAFCRNGGSCSGALNPVSCRCPVGFGGIYCHEDLCKAQPCENGGSCVGLNQCDCGSHYTGHRCEKTKLGRKSNPAPNAKAIQAAQKAPASGLHWIQPPGEHSPAQTYCDMNYEGGGWMLASYGYVHQHGTSALNKAIPNMNHPFGYGWNPTERSSMNGLIALPHGAVHLARNADWMIMAAGNNPAGGGIDSYTHVYRINLQSNPWNITFQNHNRFHGAVGSGGIPLMHITPFTVEALKGESGTFVRYALGEALGITWGDSYPTGYGFYDVPTNYGSITKGPFFPSVHSGDGSPSCSGCTAFLPDIAAGKPSYTHNGWYTASAQGQTAGQTSIWFK